MRSATSHVYREVSESLAMSMYLDVAEALLHVEIDPTKNVVGLIKMFARRCMSWSIPS
jgi:hypothetical protein